MARTVCFKSDLLKLDSVGGAKIGDGLEFFPLAVLGGRVFGQFNTVNGLFPVDGVVGA